MDYFSWVAQEEDFTSEALTVRAQALPPDDKDRLIHDVFFPRVDVDSTTLNTVGVVDFRPAGDRREWNVRGRLIPIRTPDLRSVEGIPVETYFKIEEYEMQKLEERTLGNEALFRQLIGSSLPARVDGLVNANRRRLEFDAFDSWLKGTITVMNPQIGGTATVSFDFDPARYQTAGVAWTGGVSGTAYANFIDWFQDGEDATGQSGMGVGLRRATYNAIQESAPRAVDGIKLTREQLLDRVRNDLGNDFTFFIVEHMLDKANDGGVEFTRTKVWPAETLAFIPQGVAIGEMRYAPVGRAFRLARKDPDAQIDVRGMSVFREIANNGRELTVECQVNATPVPDENRIWVMDAGI